MMFDGFKRSRVSHTRYHVTILTIDLGLERGLKIASRRWEYKQRIRTCMGEVL